MAIYANKKKTTVSSQEKIQTKEELQKKQEEQLIAFAREQISIDKQVLMSKFPFTGNVISRLDVEIGDFPDIETACTDGVKIWVNLLFYMKLDPEEKLFVLAHECWHVILRHFLRKMNRNKELWNWATDLEIHFLLTKEGLKAPFVLPHDPDWKDLSFEEIYERLLEEGKRNAKKSKKDGKGGSGNAIQISEDELGEGDNIDDFEKDGNGSSGNQKDDYPDKWNKGRESKNLKQNGRGRGWDSHDKKIPDGQEGSKEDPREAESEIAGKIKAASDFVSKRNRGNVPSHIKNILDSLPKNEIPWQQVLRQFVTQTFRGNRSWLPPNRRYVWRDMYIQSHRDQEFRGIVAIDTSGSTSSVLPKFFSELTALLTTFGNFNVKVIQCDCEIQKVEEYSQDILPPNNKKWEASGYGGTDFNPVFDYVAKKETEIPNCLIYLTDTYGPAPAKAPNYPVLWIATADVDDGQLNTFCSWGQKLRFKSNG